MAFHSTKKSISTALLMIWCLANTAAGQNTIQAGGILFQVDFSPYTNLGGFEGIPGGCGRLWLSGTNLSYRFATSRTNAISLRGSAGAGEIGPVLYEIEIGSESFNATSYCNAAAEIPPGPNPYPPPPVNPPYPPPPRPPYYRTFRITTGSIAITSEQAAELTAGRWTATFVATVRGLHRIQDVIFGGPILILDSDGDGIPDYLDHCPGTLAGSLINSNGCSIADLCPCEGPWKNHGEFEHCVKEAAQDFKKAGLITEKQRHEIEKAAHESDCGKKEKSEKPPKPPKDGK